MNISGIRPIGGFYTNSIPNIKPAAPAATEAAESAAKVAQPSEKAVAPVENKPSDDEIAKAREKQTFGAYDYASQYKPGESFSMKGADSDIRSLDVQKAVGDMKKDSVLHQYQYFVGKPEESNSSVIVRGSENFTL